MTKIPTEIDWQPIFRVSRRVPWGYRNDPEDPDILLPIPDELNLLEEAKLHVKQYSYRAVAEWLTEKSGRSISHAGLRHRVLIEKQRLQHERNVEHIAKRYAELLEKAKKLEESRLGKASNHNLPRKSQTSGD